MNIEKIFHQFQHHSSFVTGEELTSGHINDTYLIKTQQKPYYILQRINSSVFKDVYGLMNNKVLVTKHLRSKYNNTKEYQTITFIPTLDQHYCYKDEKEGYWNLMTFIDDSKSFERVTNRNLAKEAGKLFGSFVNNTHDIDVDQLVETIPNFHHMKFRFAEFDTALKNASEERKLVSSDEIRRVNLLKEEMLTLDGLTETGQIPTRVTHNDTKISNALFDKNDKAICAIDLDTVMPGIIHYDFGDAIRTICTNADEDEKDLSKVTFNLEFYKAFTEGFLSSLTHITEIEANYLAFSSKVMTFIMGLRMLTDFLNNDVYYKTKYDTHNLDRARNQFKLIEEMNLHFNQMQMIVKEYLK
ncbi:aminoglycoside phosphotransferase family protein [Pseudotenacibaculum sp. MALMAid0570]|uniref:phosphotransferase enzyme family protein n=1 Tax=Pseudotenacibaculum sp. MALMAid0570 TaxID=3143938 RepID=UPI0032DF2A7A